MLNLSADQVVPTLCPRANPPCFLNIRSAELRPFEIDASSPWVGHPLSQLQIHPKHNLLVLAVKNAGESAAPKLWVNPPEGLMIRAGAAIIVMGDVKNIREARHEAKEVNAADR